MLRNRNDLIARKNCTRCGDNLPATLVYFGKHKLHKDGLQSWCKQCKRVGDAIYRRRHLEQVRESGRRYYWQHLERVKKYRTTIKGHLTRLINSIKQRCYNTRNVDYKYYGARGIELEFTRNELENWLLENKIDPRGLDIHRKDSSKNYDLDNIEFLGHVDHAKLHRGQGQ